MAKNSDILLVPDMELEFKGEWFEFDGISEPPSHLERDFNLARGRWRLTEAGGEGCGLKVENGSIEYWGNPNEAYAILIQLLRQRPGYLPAVTVSTRKRFGFRCFHLDIARGGVPTIETFKRLVRWLFTLGYNALAVYFEDLYPWSKHPEIGLHRGRLTREEWDELCGYAKLYGLDVIPSLELLGHMENILSLPAYYKYKEMWWSRADGSLNASSREAREFAYELLEDVLDSSPSSYILVGGDETWSLGRGRSLSEGWVFRGPDLYLEHYREIIARVKKRGKHPIVWGDMLTGMYLEPKEKEVWRKVLEDKLWDEVIIANWDYSPQSQAHFEEIIDEVGRLDRQIACPGASNWNRLYPNFEDASKNIVGFLGAARKRGVMGFALTAWGDDGSECLLSFLDPIILMGIEAAESGNTTLWTQKWQRLTGESEEVVEARLTYGSKDVSDNLKKALYRHEQPPQRVVLRPQEKALQANLPEDLRFIQKCVEVASKPVEELHPSDYISLANIYAKLWLGERKPQGLIRIITRLWGSAGAVDLKL
ncbi:MAG: beta-N-acetylhexosaminidase [Thermoprotei archaeon]